MLGAAAGADTWQMRQDSLQLAAMKSALILHSPVSAQYGQPSSLSLQASLAAGGAGAGAPKADAFADAISPSGCKET